MEDDALREADRIKSYTVWGSVSGWIPVPIEATNSHEAYEKAERVFEIIRDEIGLQLGGFKIDYWDVVENE